MIPGTLKTASEKNTYSNTLKRHIYIVICKINEGKTFLCNRFKAFKNKQTIIMVILWIF